MIMRKRLVPAVLLPLLLLVPAFFSSPAFAAEECKSNCKPAWRLTGFIMPTNLVPGQEGRIELQLENIGDAPSNGEPVTVVDHLPPGVVATQAGAFEREGLGLEVPEGPWGECGGAGTSTVTCTFVGTALEPTTIEPFSYFSVGPFSENVAEEKLVSAGLPRPIGISVRVEESASGTAENTAAVSGGGAPLTATATMKTNIGHTPAPFGAAILGQWSTNANGTPDVQAGSHPYQTTTSFVLNTGAYRNEVPELSGELKNLHLTLPAGFIGNPNATPKCSREAFDVRLEETQSPNPLCPSSTQVGIAVTLQPGSTNDFPIYNLVPPAGVPAQFGFAFQHLIGFINAGVKTGEGYDAEVEVRNAVQQDVLGVSVTLWGDPADPSHDLQRFQPGVGNDAGLHNEPPIPFGAPAKPLLTLPTSCGQPLELSASLTSWADALVTPTETQFLEFPLEDMQERPVMLDGCEKLQFNPTLMVRPESSAAETPAGLEVDLKIPQNEEPEQLAEAELKEATVQLPAGMTVNPSAANGLVGCPLQGQEGINLKSGEPARCPASSKIGTVRVSTPLLEHPLEGSVFVAQQGNLSGHGSNPFGSFLAIYVVAEGSGVVAKIPGRIELNEATGQLTARFGEDPVTGEKALPQLPYSELKMNFFGGPRASLITPSGCDSYATSSRLAPWSGTPAVEPSSAFSISSGCTSGFAPSFAAGMSSNQAGGTGSFSTTLSRNDGEQRFGGVQVTTPPGLLGVIKAVVRCPEPQASQGTCGPESEIGEATVATGAGDEPYWVKGGKVYLTGPYKGAPFGLSIVVPTSAGPFTLVGNGGPGKEVVRAAINVDPHTSQITVTSDSLPTMLEGVPLDVKTVNVTVNRSGFMVNPTHCSPLAVAGTITSTSETKAQVSTPFEATNCAVLPFHPSFSASTAGKTSKADGASLDVRITAKQGPGVKAGEEEANIAKVDVEIPKALPSRLTTLQKACTEAQFNANPAGCPAASDIATVVVRTPLLGVPLTGPAYFVSHGGAAFPDVEMVLQGEGITLVVDGKTQIKNGVTYSHFETVPDAPFSSFEFAASQGPYSIFAANGNLCAQTSTKTVKKKVTKRVHGHVEHLTKTVTERVPGALVMPTTLVAQNGAEIHQDTTISVTGCPKAVHRARRRVHRKKR
jgi:hypothetical protein